MNTRSEYRQPKLVVLVMVVCAASLVGCTSGRSGTKVEREQVSQIQKGVTTRAQVEALFGLPTVASMMGDGRRMLVYHGMEVKGSSDHYLMAVPVVGSFLPHSSKTTTQRQSLHIILSKAGVVEDFEYSNTTDTTKTNTSIIGGKVESNSTPTPVSK